MFETAPLNPFSTTALYPFREMHFNRATTLKNRAIVSCKSLIEICVHNWLLFCELAVLACYWFESECALEGYFAWNTASQQNVPPSFNNIVVEIPAFRRMINTALWARIWYEFVLLRGSGRWFKESHGSVSACLLQSSFTWLAHQRET